MGLLPIRVRHKVLPRAIPRVTIRISEEVDELAFRVCAFRDEVADISDAVLLEELHRVVPEARVQVIQFSFGRVVHAHFIDLVFLFGCHN